MSKIIYYTLKNTCAKTEYRKIDDEDMNWIKTQLIKYLSLMAEMDLNSDPDSKWILQQFWHSRSDKLHKGKTGNNYRRNTPCSLIGGLVNNLLFGSQVDLTDKQMKDLEFISMALNTIHETDSIRFQINVF